MPDYNASVALGLNAEPVDLSKTINTLSNIQLSQAHSGLYTLQALQQQRQFNALQQAAAAYRGGQDPVAPYIAAGGDPAGANTLQGVFAGQRAMAATPGGLMPGAFEQLTGAAKNRAEIGKIGVETQAAGGAFASKLAGGVIADPTNDQTWAEAVDKHFDAFGGSKLQRENAKRVSDPNQRLQIARAYSGQGASPDELNRPTEYDPNKSITTPGRLMTAGGAGGGGTAPAPIIQGLSPQQQAQQKGFGEQTAAHYKESQEAYKTAATSQLGLLDLQKNLETLPEGGFWTTGKGMGTRLAFAKAVNSAMEVAGANPVFDPTKVAAGESAQKGTTRLGFDLARTLGSREAAMIVQQSIGVQPGLEMTPEGNRRITTSLMVAAQRNKDYFNFLNNYTKANPNALPGEAEISFNQQHPPSQYVSDVQKLVKVPKGAIDALRSDPKRAAEFDDHYGGDYSRYVLAR